MLARSPDLQAALDEAARRAAARAEPISSVDLLAALLELDGVRRVAGSPSLPGGGFAPEEPAGTLESLLEETYRLAARTQAPAIDALHALAILCRDTQSAAYIALSAKGHDPTRIRAAALRELTAPVPKRRRATAESSPVREPTREIAPAREPDPLPVALPAAAKPVTTVRDLVADAKDFDPLVGRTRELHLLADLLGTRRSGLIAVVGEPGTGKTALVRGLAALVARDSGAVPALREADLFELPLEVAPSQIDAARPFIPFYDGAPDPNLLRDVSSAIVALSPTELRRLGDAAPAIAGRIAQVLLAEPPADDVAAILRAQQPAFARHHRVVYDEDAIAAAARLAPRFVSDRFMPDRALAVLDLAGARARREGRAHVGEAEIAAVVAESAGIPVDRLLARDTDRLLQMERHLAAAVVGHERALERIAQVVRRNYAGFRASRPVGSFLFLGPTGVGKTETAKALADFLYGSSQAMTRLDMSEYMESHSVARLIGSPPGYVGYEDGGQLTEALRRRPDTVVLLDEIEKAHRDVLPILLQILDEGRLTDGRGRTVDFTNSIIIMTSNLGAGLRQQAAVLAAARKAFPVELWNRIEEPLTFAPLGAIEVAEVARRLARASSSRLERERGIRFELDDAAVDYLMKHGGFDRSLGARPMRAALGRLVEAPLAEAILAGEVSPGDAVRVAARAGRLSFQKA